MKQLLLSLALLYASSISAQDNKAVHKIPSAEVKNLEGKTINTNTFSNDNKPMVISFWATWCKPCVNELTAIAENYADWKKETGVKVIAISIDDTRNMSKVGPFVNGKNWDYEVFIDPNGDFKRAMNVANVPHTFLINSKGEIVWQHNSYAPGDEDKLYENIKKLAAGQSVSE